MEPFEDIELQQSNQRRFPIIEERVYRTILAFLLAFIMIVLLIVLLENIKKYI
jgi:hypothetical protein